MSDVERFDAYPVGPDDRQHIPRKCVAASDYDALAAKHDHALAIERGKLEAADAENDRLAARVAELEKDAARMDWLEDEPVRVEIRQSAIADTGDYSTYFVVVEQHMDADKEREIGIGPTWRSAIDCAMASPDADACQHTSFSEQAGGPRVCRDCKAILPPLLPVNRRSPDSDGDS